MIKCITERLSLENPLHFSCMDLSRDKYNNSSALAGSVSFWCSAKQARSYCSAILMAYLHAYVIVHSQHII